MLKKFRAYRSYFKLARDDSALSAQIEVLVYTTGEDETPVAREAHTFAEGDLRKVNFEIEQLVSFLF